MDALRSCKSIQDKPRDWIYSEFTRNLLPTAREGNVSFCSQGVGRPPPLDRDPPGQRSPPGQRLPSGKRPPLLTETPQY